jgi:hypothetical protein
LDWSALKRKETLQIKQSVFHPVSHAPFFPPPFPALAFSEPECASMHLASPCPIRFPIGPKRIAALFLGDTRRARWSNANFVCEVQLRLYISSNVVSGTCDEAVGSAARKKCPHSDVAPFHPLLSHLQTGAH